VLEVPRGALNAVRMVPELPRDYCVLIWLTHVSADSVSLYANKRLASPNDNMKPCRVQSIILRNSSSRKHGSGISNCSILHSSSICTSSRQCWNQVVAPCARLQINLPPI